MLTLPECSRASASNGMWFVFKDGDDIIHAWGSYWTGLERLFLNGVLKVQTTARNQPIEFASAQHLFRVELCAKKLAIGQLKCTLFKDGEPHVTIRSKRRKVINTRPIVSHIVACGLFGLLAGFFALPLWSVLSCFMLSFGITLLSNAKTDTFVIDQRNDNPVTAL